MHRTVMPDLQAQLLLQDSQWQQGMRDQPMPDHVQLPKLCIMYSPNLFQLQYELLQQSG